MGRALGLNMTKYGSREGTGWVPGSTPLPATPVPTTPGTPSRWPEVRTRWLHHAAGPYHQCNIAVGLKSVDQLSLDLQISGFRGITEVYNLAVVRDPNDHNVIPGTK